MVIFGCLKAFLVIDTPLVSCGHSRRSEDKVFAEHDHRPWWHRVSHVNAPLGTLMGSSPTRWYLTRLSMTSEQGYGCL
jgi:hypothetical protein